MSTTLAIAVVAYSSSSVAQEYACKAEGVGVSYDLKIILKKGEIEGVSYRSITNDATASTCDLTVFKGNKSSYSTWFNKSRTESVIFINALDDGSSIERVNISRDGLSFGIALGNSDDFDVHRMECGMTGSLAPTIEISLDKRCVG